MTGDGSTATRSAAPLPRRAVVRAFALAAAALGLRLPLPAWGRDNPDRERLADWTGALRAARLVPPADIGRAAVRVGELARGTPYVARTLEAYIGKGGDPSGTEPLILSLTRFDCVTLVEACLAVARTAAAEGAPDWDRFAAEVERMRYRGGERRGYASRLHYFSEWIADGERRGLVRDLGRDLGGRADDRPLRFMTWHRESYPALAHETVYARIGEIERALDGRPRYVVPKDRIPEVTERIESGDVLAFATAIPGLDVTHSAFAYRGDDGVLRVLHAPLSGGVVEVTRATLSEYVAAIRRATGILVARPCWGVG